DGIHLEWHNLDTGHKSTFVDVAKTLRNHLKHKLLFIGIHPKQSTAYNVELLHSLADSLLLYPYAKERSQPRLAVPPILYGEDVFDFMQVSKFKYFFIDLMQLCSYEIFLYYQN